MSAPNAIGLIVVDRADLRLPALRAAARGAVLARWPRAGSRSRSSARCSWPCVPLLGGYMARVFTRRARVPRPGRSARRARHLPAAARRPRARARTGRPTPAALLVFSLAVLARALPDPAHPDAAPVQPAGLPLRHRGTSRSTPSRRSSRTRTGSSTAARRRCRTSARWPGWRCRTSSRRPSASSSPIALIRGIVAAARSATPTLGNFWQDLTRTIALRAAADLDRRRGACSSRRASLQTLGGTVRRPRPRGPVASQEVDQGARHQRRRLLQRQLGDAVREPDRALELRRDVPDPLHPGLADLHVRAHGRQPPPGLGDLRGDVGAVRRRRRRRLRRRAARHAGPARRRRPHGVVAARPAATSRARSSASGSPTRRC